MGSSGGFPDMACRSQPLTAPVYCRPPALLRTTTHPLPPPLPLITASHLKCVVALPPKFAVAANVSNVARAWNEFRYEILRAAITQHLFPIFEREVKQRLLAEAKEVAMNE